MRDQANFQIEHNLHNLAFLKDKIKHLSKRRKKNKAKFLFDNKLLINFKSISHEHNKAILKRIILVNSNITKSIDLPVLTKITLTGCKNVLIIFKELMTKYKHIIFNANT